MIFVDSYYIFTSLKLIVFKNFKRILFTLVTYSQFTWALYVIFGVKITRNWLGFSFSSTDYDFCDFDSVQNLIFVVLV